MPAAMKKLVVSYRVEKEAVEPYSCIQLELHNHCLLLKNTYVCHKQLFRNTGH